MPHYIVPQSNLLKYEAPSRLNEAAVVVAEVRRNIFPKTVNLLRRLQSLTYQSQTYLQNTGLQLEDHLSKMQDKSLSEEEHRELLEALFSLFVGKCKDVVTCLRGITPTERQGIEKAINVAMYIYQSILARNLCKLWFLRNDESNDSKVLDDDQFKFFVHAELEKLWLNEDFLELALMFFDRTRKANDPSLAISKTGVMMLLREEQMKMAKENVVDANAELKGVLDLLKTMKLQGRAEGTAVTKEEMERLFDVELGALIQEIMKNSK